MSTPQTTTLHGEVLTLNEQGQIACRAQFVDGLLHGLTERYDDDQRLLQTIPYRAGLIDGRMTIFTEGVLMAEIDYQRGLCHGELVSYGPNASLSSRVAHVHGKAQGLAQYFYPDGVLARRAQHVDGLLEGEVCDYGQDGTLLARTVYRQGKKHGLASQYHPNGKLRETMEFADGQPIGAPRKYDEEGAPVGAGPAADKRERPLARLSKWIEG